MGDYYLGELGELSSISTEDFQLTVVRKNRLRFEFFDSEAPAAAFSTDDVRSGLRSRPGLSAADDVSDVIVSERRKMENKVIS